MSEEILTAEDIRRFRMEWRTEAEDRIATANDVLTKMQKTYPDPQNLKEFMRALHSMKGTSAMLGFREIADFNHHLEEYCELFRGTEALPFSHFSPELLQSGINELLNSIESMDPDQDPVIQNPTTLQKIDQVVCQLAQERAQHFTAPDLPQRPPETTPWPLLKALDSLQKTPPICEHCPYGSGPTAIMAPKKYDSEDLKVRLLALNALDIEPCILVIDDQPEISGLVGALIRSILPKARIIETDMARKAFNLLQSVMGDQIDLVITDLLMPEINGLEVTRLVAQLKNQGSLFANTMIMTAARPNEKDFQDSLQLGVREFLLKPFGVEELMHSLIPSIRDAMINRLLTSIFSYSQRVYLGFNRLERETDIQLKSGIKREVHELLLLMAKAQKSLQQAQALPSLAYPSL